METAVSMRAKTSNTAPRLEERRAFKEDYLRRLVPIIIKIRQRKAVSTAHDRLRAVNFAVNVSFAFTVRRVSDVMWGRALINELLGRQRRRNNAIRSLGSRLYKPQRTRICRYGNIVAKRLRTGRLLQPRRLIAWRRLYMQSIRRVSFCSGKTATSCFHSECKHPIQKHQTQKMNTLRLLIPGGADMNPAKLLDEATQYIVALEMQVEALQTLAKFAHT